MPPASRPKKTSIDEARLRLRQAIDRACVARGEAQWMNGYRAGRYGRGSDQSDDELYRKEQGRFEQCGKAEAQAERAMATYARTIRQSCTR